MDRPGSVDLGALAARHAWVPMPAIYGHAKNGQCRGDCRRPGASADDCRCQACLPATAPWHPDPTPSCPPIARVRTLLPSTAQLNVVSILECRAVLRARTKPRSYSAAKGGVNSRHKFHFCTV